MTIADDVREDLIEKNRIQEKQRDLIRQLKGKYSISEIEKNIILVVNNPKRLDLALDEVTVADTKERVISLLL